MPRTRHTTFTALLIFISLPLTSAEEWNRFRGPNGSGVATEGSVPATWEDDDYKWTIDLPGVGSSSPIIWQDKIFLTAADVDAGQRSLICLKADTGETLWSQSVPFTTYKKHKNNSYASSTPCCDEKHVYVAWHDKAGSSLTAYDHGGKQVWTYDLGSYAHGQGGATSPIVYGDLVVIAHDQKQPSFLLAVNRKTGKEVWKIPREGKRACYATPCVFKVDGQPNQIVFSHCYEGVIGVSPEDGRQLWHVDVFGRESQRALGSVVQAGDLVVATSGAFGSVRKTVAIKPTSTKANPAVEAWRTTKQTPHVPTPLIYQDWMFLWSDQGIVSCLEHATGKVVWKKRVGGNYFGSPICVGGKLYCIDLDGTVAVVEASDEYKLHGRIKLGEPSKSTPAFSNGTLFLRTETKLRAL